LTSSSLMNFSTSDESENMETPEVGHSGSPSARADFYGTVPGGDCPAVTPLFPACYTALDTLDP
jgi:hypothetical protein